mgnify:FL=1
MQCLLGTLPLSNTNPLNIDPYSHSDNPEDYFPLESIKAAELLPDGGALYHVGQDNSASDNTDAEANTDFYRNLAEDSSRMNTLAGKLLDDIKDDT